MSEYVGLQGIGDLLGVSRQRAHQLLVAGELPDAEAICWSSRHTHQMWSRQTIEEYATRRGRDGCSYGLDNIKM